MGLNDSEMGYFTHFDPLLHPSQLDEIKSPPLAKGAPRESGVGDVKKGSIIAHDVLGFYQGRGESVIS